MRCQSCRAPVSASAGMCCNCGTIVDDHPGVQWALELSERAPEMADLISDPRPAVRAVWDQLRKEQQ